MKNRGKSIAYIVLGGLLLAGGVVLLCTVGEPEGIYRALPYLLIGIGCGVFGGGLGDYLAARAVKNEPELQRQIEVEQNDERNQIIRDRAKSRGYTVMTTVFSALLLAYAFMDAPLEILLPFVAAYLFVQGYVVVQFIKLEKKY